MLRLAHTQVSTGGILINDIDDGLPNKTAKRGVGDKNKYQRDGNSLGGTDRSTARDVNNPKQKCYIPYWKILSVNPLTYSSSIPGFIDISESDRALISQDRGVIYGLLHHVASDGVTPQPLISVTSFASTDVASPTITSAAIAAGGAYSLTIGGTKFTSLAPDVSSVTVGTTVISATAIIAASGTFTDTSIVIPEALLPAIIAGHTNVVAVAIANLALTGEQTIDGVLTSTSRVLLTGQTNPIQNGIYVTAAGAWARASDLAAAAHASGVRVTASAGGTLRGGTSWLCTTAAPTDVVGTDSLAFAVGASATFVSVTADSNTASHVITATNTPLTLSAAELSAGAGTLTLTGTGLRSILPNLTSVSITGGVTVTITAAAILGALIPGSITDTQIVVPASIVTADSIVDTTCSAQVLANGSAALPALAVVITAVA